MDTTQIQIKDLTDRLGKLQGSFDTLAQGFYKNNFTSHQDFNKSCNFTFSLQIPLYTTLPTTNNLGEICAYSTAGTVNLMISTATNTWVVVGTQS